jgi:hypothetical protein
MQRMFQQTWFVPGTLAADHVIDFTAPCGMTLVHVSASNTSANAGTLKIGNAADDDEHLTAFDFGVSNTPTEADGDDFVDSDGSTHNRYYPHIDDGEVVKVTLTDHASHMANAAVVLTFVAD